MKHPPTSKPSWMYEARRFATEVIETAKEISARETFSRSAVRRLATSLVRLYDHIDHRDTMWKNKLAQTRKELRDTRKKLTRAELQYTDIRSKLRDKQEN